VSADFRRVVQGLALGAILLMIVVAVRLNERDARDAGAQAAAVFTYEQDLKSWRERLRACERNRRAHVANLRGWERALERAQAQAEDDNASSDVRRTSARAAVVYAKTVQSLETLAATRCALEHTAPSPPESLVG
jgi:hypothetical protein